jgi:micrococcal nuclease
VPPESNHHGAVPPCARQRPPIGFTAPCLPMVDDPVLVIIDGDTFALGQERIRILNIDTPETRGSHCENELVQGLRAKERLASLLRPGHIDVARDGRDRYGRTLARVSAQGRDIGEVLIREGLALQWQVGSHAKVARIRH